MKRHVLPEDQIHPDIRQKVAASNRDIVDEVLTATSANDVVIVGMGQNPVVRKARKLLDARGTKYAYLEYGNYLNNWRRRNALKMWTGWPTFPMVFHKGVLIGGGEDLERYIQQGGLG